MTGFMKLPAASGWGIRKILINLPRPMAILFYELILGLNSADIEEDLP
jgi:hypothetical protein